MKYVIYTNIHSRGDLVPLSYAIHRSTSITGLDAVRLATSIFYHQFKEENPLILDVVIEGAPTELIEACGNLGVIIKPLNNAGK